LYQWLGDARAFQGGVAATHHFVNNLRQPADFRRLVRKEYDGWVKSLSVAVFVFTATA
jgi:hypothetical protein